MKTEDEVLKTSWTLVVRIKNLDDRAHWQEFYELYRGLITGVARPGRSVDFPLCFPRRSG